jgi:enolase-phosphatase E1
VILLDIEGTTTPVAFVTEVLFPYVRTRLRSHLVAHANAPGYASIVAGLRDEHAAVVRAGETVPLWTDDPSTRLDASLSFVEWLMDRDRKSTALKELQGRIWEDGYRRGDLVGQVFPDVLAALQRWQQQGVSVGIFSSGSVMAQQLLFRHSTAGDLTRFLRWHFDTHVGPKTDPASYVRIAVFVGISAGNILFLSDAIKELDAARRAGMQVRLVVRPGNLPVLSRHDYQTIHSLNEVVLGTGASAGRER